jgi:hypothetical protein
MSRIACLIIAALAVAAIGTAYAQHPILDKIAGKVIQKYQSSSCEELLANRGKHSPEEQWVVQFLKEDPQVRTEFFNKVAAPIVNKMFECGMVP